MQVMDAILSCQQQMGVGGHLAEFGVFKGRSAAVISAHVEQGERFLLVDIERYISNETLGSFSRSRSLAWPLRGCCSEIR
jgi:hypothetical protein